jgi:hypothetical protein
MKNTFMLKAPKSGIPGFLGLAQNESSSPPSSKSRAKNVFRLQKGLPLVHHAHQRASGAGSDDGHYRFIGSLWLHLRLSRSFT